MKFKEFSGYILAGGRSSRMGRAKAFLQIGKKTFVENTIEILKPICRNRIKIILNPSQTDFPEDLPANIPFIFDIYENRGALAGIHAGLKDCQTEFAIILAVDLPFVTSKAIEKLCEIAPNSSKSTAIVPRQNGGRLQPLCAVYQAKNCWPKLEDILSKETSVSVKSFLETIEIKVVPAKDLGRKQNLFANINSQKDLQKLDSENI